MKHSIGLLVVGLLLFVSKVYSQPVITIDNVENFSLDNLHVFTNNTGPAGFACCYEVKDKSVDGKKYTVKAFDNQLAETNTWSFTCNDRESLLSTSYNGTDFIAIILDGKKKLLHHRIYNAAGESTKQFVDKLDVNSEYYLEKNLPAPKDLLFKLGNNGYLSLVPTKHNDVFTYDANIFLKSAGYERKQFTPETDVKTQRASYVGSTGNLLLFYVFRKKVMVSNKYESNLIGIDAATGERKFEISTKEGDAPFLPLKVVTGTTQNEFTVLGHYFKENGRVKRTSATGLCLLRMDGAGQILAKTTTSWKEKFDADGPEKVVADTAVEENEAVRNEATDSAAENNENVTAKDSTIKKIKNFQLHAFTQTLNGDMYIIGEAYRTGVEASVTATNVLLAGAGLALGLWMVPQVRQTPITITDMVVLHANSSLQIDSIYRFAKQEHRSLQFDMDFVTTLPAQNQFFVGYKDYNQGKGDDRFTEKMLHCSNGIFTTTQNTVTTKAPTYQVFPIRQKEVMLAEYYSKQNRVVLSVKQLQP